jgi:chromosome segregation ATPase
MKILQRWLQTSLANKMLVITGCLMAAGTLSLAAAATFQYLVTREQAEITRGQLQTMRDQTSAMQGQLDSINDQAASMREQTNTLRESLEETKSIVRQNERVVKATEIQAASSAISAGAARKTTHIAEESMILSSRPYVDFSQHLRKKPRVWSIRVIRTNPFQQW